MLLDCELNSRSVGLYFICLLPLAGSEKRATDTSDAPAEDGMEWEDNSGQQPRPSTAGQPGVRQTPTPLRDDDQRQVVSFSLHQRR